MVEIELNELIEKYDATTSKVGNKRVPSVLKLSEVAFFLRKSVRTVRRYIDEGKISSVKLCGSVFVETKEFVDFVRRQKEKNFDF